MTGSGSDAATDGDADADGPGGITYTCLPMPGVVDDPAGGVMGV